MTALHQRQSHRVATCGMKHASLGRALNLQCMCVKGLRFVRGRQGNVVSGQSRVKPEQVRPCCDAINTPNSWIQALHCLYTKVRGLCAPGNAGRA